MSKFLYIKTLGCAMNVRDSEHIIAELKNQSYDITDDVSKADVIVINTCSVREKPVHKLFSEIGAFEKMKKNGAKIGVCGCTASHLGYEIFKRAPFVDFVLGARNISKIQTAINSPKFISVDIDNDESLYKFGEYRNSIYKTYVNIMIGCDKKCAYCIVPHTRGDEISIPPDIILNEIQKAANNGAKEVILLGQNVNNYGKRFSVKTDKMDFSDLLRAISQISKIERIRFTSPHPLHMDDKFIDEFVNNDKICKSIHMPLQSGSNAILRSMRRGYTKEWFLNRANKIRTLCENVAISTDIIVAFPGESEEDFMQTIEVMKEVKFEQIFSFKFSPRPHTFAAQMTNFVDENTASNRLMFLQNLQNEILDEIMLKQRGKILSVYFDELRPNGKISGRSDNNFLVEIDGSEDLLGCNKNVLINQAKRMILYGKIQP